MPVWLEATDNAVREGIYGKYIFLCTFLSILLNKNIGNFFGDLQQFEKTFSFLELNIRIQHIIYIMYKALVNQLFCYQTGFQSTEGY